MANTGFKYIDDDLQNLRQVINFKLGEIIPKELSPTSSKTRNDLEVITMETRPNKDVVVVDHRPLIGITSSTSLSGEASSKPCSGAQSKPPFHYSDLIEFALRDKEQLTVSEIYDWIIQRFPYFKQVDENRWKPAVRHTLTTNSGFYKAKKANRGYLWAYISPEQRKKQRAELQMKLNLNNSDAGTHHWKKQKLAEYNTELPTIQSPVIPSATEHEQVDLHMRVPGSKNNALLLKPVKMKKRSNIRIPAVPLLAHSHRTIVLESSDNDSDNDDEEGDEEEDGRKSSREQCHCRVEYFIPTMPSDMNINNNSSASFSPCVPCCREGQCRSLEDGQEDGIAQGKPDCFSLWDPHCHSKREKVKNDHACKEVGAHGITNRITRSGSRDKKKHSKVTKNCIISPPSISQSKSGVILYVPLTVPVYKTGLKDKDNSAHLQKVPKEVAVLESGLFEIPPSSDSQVTAIPSVSSLFNSKSSTMALEEIFKLDDLNKSINNIPSETSVNGTSPVLHSMYNLGLD